MTDFTTTLTATYFFDGSTPTVINKNLLTRGVIDKIRNYITTQHEYLFGAKPDMRNLDLYVDGFVLFHLHKNKYMLKNKTALLNYVNDNSISLEEKQYFLDIFLYNQKLPYLSADEHEKLRC